MFSDFQKFDAGRAKAYMKGKLVKPEGRSLRILVADDNELVRRSICSLLNSHEAWIVCGEAADGQEALDKVLQLMPSVLLVDVSMPRINGFELAKRIQERLPGTAILIVTGHDPSVLKAIPRISGIRGYVTKSRLNIDLIPAVEAAAKPPSLALSASA